MYRWKNHKLLSKFFLQKHIVKHQTKVNPNFLLVRTIIEEAEQSPATVAKSRTNRNSKLIENTAAPNQTESVEKIQSNSQTITSSSKVTSTVVITSSSKSAATSSQAHSTNVDFTSRQLDNTSKNKRVTSSKSKEVNQNELNRIFEESANSRVLTSTPISSSTPVSALRQHNATSPLNGNRTDHAAYNEYRDAGEYWK